MSIFKTLTLKWWQVGLFKLCLLCLGIILGVYFQVFFLRWIAVVAVVCVLTGLYVLKVWWKE